MGQLRKIIAGETESEFGYDTDSGTLDSVITRIGGSLSAKSFFLLHL